MDELRSGRFDNRNLLRENVKFSKQIKNNVWQFVRSHWCLVNDPTNIKDLDKHIEHKEQSEYEGGKCGRWWHQWGKLCWRRHIRLWQHRHWPERGDRHHGILQRGGDHWHHVQRGQPHDRGLQQTAICTEEKQEWRTSKTAEVRSKYAILAFQGAWCAPSNLVWIMFLFAKKMFWLP